jgi:hypothetical protein
MLPIATYDGCRRTGNACVVALVVKCWRQVFAPPPDGVAGLLGEELGSVIALRWFDRVLARL